MRAYIEAIAELVWQRERGLLVSKVRDAEKSMALDIAREHLGGLTGEVAALVREEERSALVANILGRVLAKLEAQMEDDVDRQRCLDQSRRQHSLVALRCYESVVRAARDAWRKEYYRSRSDRKRDLHNGPAFAQGCRTYRFDGKSVWTMLSDVDYAWMARWATQRLRGSAPHGPSEQELEDAIKLTFEGEGGLIKL